jgi:hypothetical protein
MNMPPRPLKLNLESLYLLTAVSLDADGPGGHGIRLTLTGRGESDEMTGTLALDPNACSLNAFGDREMCTKIAIRTIPVTATLQRLGDPKRLGRSFYALHTVKPMQEIIDSMLADFDRDPVEALNHRPLKFDVDGRPVDVETLFSPWDIRAGRDVSGRDRRARCCRCSITGS